MRKFEVRHQKQVRKSGSEMRVAMFSWESLHSIRVGSVAAHVTELAAALERLGNEAHVFTRMGHGQLWYEVIDGVHYHRCPFDLNPDFVQEMNNMCRSFAWHFFETENVAGHFIIHGHDWMTANALAEVRNVRGKRAVFTLHSTGAVRQCLLRRAIAAYSGLGMVRWLRR
ncbi:MAG: Glycosyltransferase involved in cell wall bisynthesis [Candidatus Alkanophagales archaeon MCA70_species_1]|nr:Glycosyltransferase involved in cell wall bisynthesis [Candidatus Alkanophaga volatiphilum]